MCHGYSGGWELVDFEEAAETSHYGEVMVVGELCRDVGRAHAQEIGTRRATAEKQQQPGSLEILEVGDAVEQVLVLLVCLADLVLDEGAGAEGAPRTVSPRDVSGKFGLPTQTSFPSSSMFGGGIPAAFHTRVLLRLSWMRAWLWSV